MYFLFQLSVFVTSYYYRSKKKKKKISQSKRNQTPKFGQAIEHNKRNISLRKLGEK